MERKAWFIVTLAALFAGLLLVFAYGEVNAEADGCLTNDGIHSPMESTECLERGVGFRFNVTYDRDIGPSGYPQTIYYQCASFEGSGSIFTVEKIPSGEVVARCVKGLPTSGTFTDDGFTAYKLRLNVSGEIQDTFKDGLVKYRQAQDPPDDVCTSPYLYSLPLGGSILGKVEFGQDQDWYLLHVTQAGRVRLQLTVPSGVDYNMELFGSCGTLINDDGDNHGAGDQEVIEQLVLPGDYRIHVWGDTTPSDGQKYELKAQLTLIDKAKVTVSLVAHPNTARDFLFYGPFGNFLLDNPVSDDGDAAPVSIGYIVRSGDYFFNESPPNRWFLKEITCSEPTHVNTVMSMFGVQFRPVAGDNLNCTFVNEQATMLYITSYQDLNNDGAFGPNDVVLPHVWTSLYDGNHKIIYGNFTNAEGEWNLVRLRPGLDYVVCQTTPAGFSNLQPGIPDPEFDNRPCYHFTAQPAQLYEAEFGYGDPAAQVTSPPGLKNSLRVTENVVDNGDGLIAGLDADLVDSGYVMEFPPQLFLPQLTH